MSITATAVVQIIALIAFVWFCLTYIWPDLRRAFELRKAALVKESHTLSQTPDFKAKSEANDRSSL